jgi:hypothetical protein
MQTAKDLLDTLKAKVKARVEEERAATDKKLRGYQERLENTEEFETLSEAEQDALREPFNELAREIEHHCLIAVMRDRLHRFQSERYPTLLHKMTEWAARDEEGEAGKGAAATAEEEVQYVTRASLSVDFDKPWLADEGDVDRYLTALRKALMRAIEAGKRIHI